MVEWRPGGQSRAFREGHWRADCALFPAVDEFRTHCAYLDEAEPHFILVRQASTGTLIFRVSLMGHGVQEVYGLHLRWRPSQILHVACRIGNQASILEFDLAEGTCLTLYSGSAKLSSCELTVDGLTLCVAFRDGEGSHIALIQRSRPETLTRVYSTLLLISNAFLSEDRRSVAFTAYSPRSLLDHRAFLLKMGGQADDVTLLDVWGGSARVEGWTSREALFLRSNAEGHDRLYAYALTTWECTPVDTQCQDLQCVAVPVDDGAPTLLAYIDGTDTRVQVEAHASSHYRVPGTVNWMAHCGTHLLLLTSSILRVPSLHTLHLATGVSAHPEASHGEVSHHLAPGPRHAVPYYRVQGERHNGRALICLKGGPGDFWTNQQDFIVSAALELGYAVFLPNLRGSGGQGTLYRQALVKQWGEVDLEDLTTVHRQVLAAGYAPQCVDMFGHSYGAYLALLAAAKLDVSVVVAWAGLTDLSHADQAYPDLKYYLHTHLGDVAAAPETWRARSPMGVRPRPGTRVCLLHGQDDTVVPVSESQRLQAHWGALQTTLVQLPGMGHAATTPGQRATLKSTLQRALSNGVSHG